MHVLHAWLAGVKLYLGVGLYILILLMCICNVLCLGCVEFINVLDKKVSLLYTEYNDSSVLIIILKGFLLDYNANYIQYRSDIYLGYFP